MDYGSCGAARLVSGIKDLGSTSLPYPCTSCDISVFPARVDPHLLSPSAKRRDVDLATSHGPYCVSALDAEFSAS
ncbi:UNVERIFIED_CONTAM: hypothetical protein Sradi_2074400 [Sesamum radiatum]|uniref:Uncharacterized protein n=1 Tax=Sesamum radiatum TaxID=300843 RepID=A0AAW2TKY6_SESRA